MRAETSPFRRLSNITQYWRPFAAFGIALLFWLAASRFGWVDPRFLPSPGSVASRAATELTTGTLAFDVAESLRRNLTGFAIGASAGLFLGLVLGFSRTAERIVGPTLLAFRQIALFAWVPLISVWFGGADAGKIAFIAVAAFQPVVINTWRGVRDLPAAYRELSAVLLFSRLDFAPPGRVARRLARDLYRPSFWTDLCLARHARFGTVSQRHARHRRTPQRSQPAV